MLEQIITAVVGVGILGGAYFIDLIVGVAKVMFTPTLKWSWKKMLQDLAKAIVMSVGIVGFVAILQLVSWYSERNGANLSLLKELSLPALTASILGGCVWYLSGAFINIKNFLNAKNVKVEVDASKSDYGRLVKESTATIKNAIESVTPLWTTNRQQSSKKSTPTQSQIDEVVSGQGAGINPLTRRLADGDNDSGKGWQCSKYAYFLATGIRMNYAPHPDYGPVNGNQMVDYLVNKFGFVRCGKEAGAIFSYNSGQFGHTGIVVDPQSNTVNDANWLPLRVSTHYLNLEAVGAIYCKPRDMVAITPSVSFTPPAPILNNDPTKAVDDVIAGKFGNGQERIVNLRNAGFDPVKVQQLVNERLKPQPVIEASSDVISRGARVVPINGYKAFGNQYYTDYDGTAVQVWRDKVYIAVEVVNDRAVLAPEEAPNMIWCAMNIKNVRKVN